MRRSSPGAKGLIAHLGPMVVRTGVYTGRSPRDKFIVKEPSSAHHISWGPENQPLALEKFDLLYYRLLAFLQGKELFVQDCYAGADPSYRMSIRIITTQAWQNLFARNLFVQIKDQQELAQHAPEFTIISAPDFHAVPELDGTSSQAFIMVHFGKKLILIGGTGYGGEIKKSIFTMMNYQLPQQGVMPMHCSANVGRDGTAAIFFGLSGTGKTSLSADPDRQLVGDDEHAWSDDGIFNFEGGCYAKVIRLSPEAEPQIYAVPRCLALSWKTSPSTATPGAWTWTTPRSPRTPGRHILSTTSTIVPNGSRSPSPTCHYADLRRLRGASTHRAAHP